MAEMISLPASLIDDDMRELTETELRITLYVWRQSRAEGRESAAISISQFQEIGITGANGEGIHNRRIVTAAIKRLEERGVLRVERQKNAQRWLTNVYTFVERNERKPPAAVSSTNNAPSVQTIPAKEAQAKRRRSASDKRLAAAIAVYEGYGYPEYLIYHGTRSNPRDIAKRLNTLEKEIATDPDPQGEKAQVNRLIATYLETELTAEMKLRDQEHAAQRASQRQ